MSNTQYNEWGLDKEPKRLQGSDIMSVVRRTSGLAFAQTWIWVISLSLFPAVTGGVSPATGWGALQGRFSEKAIFVGLHYLVYNCGDWTGRILTGLSNIFVSTNPTVIAIVALSRTAFIPLFMMCNAEKPLDGSNALLPTFINSDMGYFIVLLLFAISNGWTSSCAFMAAPSKVDTPEEEEVAGIVQSFTMSFGSTIGSLGGFGVRGVFICKCNPFIS
jgi:equilibrative nucleoside transporter 1/2/3